MKSIHELLQNFTQHISEKAYSFMHWFSCNISSVKYHQSDNPELSTPTDVVYIGVVQSKHLEVASEMLRKRKPVLCEKPLCMTVRETQELVELARQNKVFLMEVR